MHTGAILSDRGDDAPEQQPADQQKSPGRKQGNGNFGDFVCQIKHLRAILCAGRPAGAKSAQSDRFSPALKKERLPRT